MSRYDDYVIDLQKVKKEIEEQIAHCEITLAMVNNIKTLVDYDDAATVLEKSNIEALITLISGGLAALKAVVWE